MKTALVTGGAGFIGSHLVEELLRLNYEVLVVDDMSLGKLENLPKSDKLFVAGRDARIYSNVESVLSRTLGNVDVIFNLAVIPLPASLSSPKDTYDTNTTITSSMCELVRDGYADTLVQFSSSEVYGTARCIPMDESHPFDAMTPYAASKAASDLLVESYGRTFGIDYVIVRPFNVIGPRQNMAEWAGVVPATIKRCMAGEPAIVHGDGSFTRDFSYVGDIVGAAIRLYHTQGAHGRAVNVGSGVETTIEELVVTIADLFDAGCSVVHDSERPGDVRQMVADTSLAMKLIGYEPKVSLDEAIEKTVAWYVRSGKSTSPA
ncbi:MAG: SDR family NAD(P)-dependent oxidoreductase [Acholeplasmataceae bacterium]|jgi:UDP-glucose 4-epimerase